MGILQKYPEVGAFLDKTDDYVNEGKELSSGGKKYLVVTQKGPIDSGQLLFQITPNGLVLEDTDTTVSVGAKLGTFASASALVCRVSDPEDIKSVYDKAVASVDHFSSKTGPDGGNLACVWAVRNIAHEALGRWITRTDGTAIFDPELRRCFADSLTEAQVPAGGIIISPTEGHNIGHVGLMGPPTGDGTRLIYSNSSGAAIRKQNFTLGDWVKRYKTKKGLKVHFFPIPSYLTPTA
jgi:hypothetical protein